MQKVCVIGSGVMGSGIAAEIANSRTEVILLDIADQNSNNPNAIVQSALDKMSNLAITSPASSPLAHPSFIKYITIGNLQDDLNLVADCDLVIEVIVEKLKIKHQLYAKLLPVLKKGAVLASNTSTLPLVRLKENLPKEIAQNFVITHFFNPPRFMDLLELVADKNTHPEAIKRISEFLTNKLGKTIVKCHDYPGFIANRVGCFLLEMTVRRAIDEKLELAAIDYIFTNLLGFPSTGIFGLYDLIGHDVMNLISNSLISALPKNDKYHEIFTNSDILSKMIAASAIGRKAGQGFYRMNIQNEQKVKEVLQLENPSAELAYKKVELPNDLPKDISQLMNQNSAYSNFFRRILGDFFSYNAGLLGQAADNPEDIDTAMRLGYNLKFGPFELMAKFSDFGIVPAQFNSYKVSNNAKTLTHKTDEIMQNDFAKLLSYKDRYVFQLNSKMNVLNQDVFHLLIDSVKKCEDENKNLYITHSGNNFSSGADLKFFKSHIENKNFKAIDEFLSLGQKAMMTMKYSPVFITACASGFALGGGCEILLHLDLIYLHKNLNAGLVELGVGLLPAFGGTKEMFMRGQGNPMVLTKNLDNILMQNKSTSGEYFGIDYGVNYKICANKNLLLDTAIDNDKNINHKSTVKIEKLSIPAIKVAKDNYERLDIVQQEVANSLQKIIEKKIVTEQELLDFEREEFLKLAAMPEALKRISRFV